MRGILTRLFGGAEPSERNPSQQLHLSELPPLTYVIGDIHGMSDLYRKLERHIAAEADGQPCLIVCVGDVVDRGQDSAGVIDQLMATPPKGLQRLVLMGNHEEMFLEFLTAPHSKHPWLSYGGRETLASYGIYGDPMQGFEIPTKRLRQMIEASIPAEHVSWMRNLPMALNLGGRYFVSHSGIDPNKPLEMQTSRDLMWTRGMNVAPPEGITVIHGHTPVEAVGVTGPYINVDTGAYASGRLSAVRLTPAGFPQAVEVSI